MFAGDADGLVRELVVIMIAASHSLVVAVAADVAHGVSGEVRYKLQ